MNITLIIKQVSSASPMVVVGLLIALVFFLRDARIGGPGLSPRSAFVAGGLLTTFDMIWIAWSWRRPGWWQDLDARFASEMLTSSAEGLIVGFATTGLIGALATGGLVIVAQIYRSWRMRSFQPLIDGDGMWSISVLTWLAALALLLRVLIDHVWATQRGSINALITVYGKWHSQWIVALFLVALSALFAWLSHRHSRNAASFHAN